MAAYNPLLSIVIPTRNRTEILVQQIRVLENALQDRPEVEILISDNSDVPSNFDFSNSKLNISILRPTSKLATAEENLFFALRYAKGEYVWPLGDDDVPLKAGVEVLLKECRNSDIDGMSFNTRNMGIYGQVFTYSRIDCPSETLDLTYEEFLERMGFWSIPAGISLTVVRREDLLRNLDLVSDRQEKIYSHVALYALALRDKKFRFINQDLVLYQTNLYDVESHTADHWEIYGSTIQMFYRYPWTLSFIRLLKLMREEGAIGDTYLSKALDVGHFGNRFLLLEAVLGFVIDQLINDLSASSTIPMKVEELVEIVDYLEKSDPTYTYIYRTLRLIAHPNYQQKGSRNRLKAKLVQISLDLQSHLAQMPYSRFYRRVYGHHLVYDTPMGWIAIQPVNTLLRSALDDALIGIALPEYLELKGRTWEELRHKIDKQKSTAPNISGRVDLSLLGSNYQISYLRKRSLLRRIWGRLPESIRKHIRPHLA